MCKAKHRYGVDTTKCCACKAVWNDISLICVRDMCPKSMKEHLAVQAGQLETPDKQKAVIREMGASKCHGERPRTHGC